MILHGDCLTILPTLDAESVDAVVTDPPYGLGFMGKKWDTPGSMFERRAEKKNRFDHVGGNHNPTSSADSARTRRVEGKRFQAFMEAWAVETYRVLKPGAHLLAFGGTRTFHRLTCAIEDAGFEIRDCLMYLYGSGFPKSLNVGCRCAESKTKYDLRPVRDADLSSPVQSETTEGQVLLAGLSESSIPAQGTESGKAGDAGRGESRMEGRRDDLQDARELRRRPIRPSAGMGDADGAKRRLRDGASADRGADGRATSGADRDGPSSGSRADSESSGESGGVAGQPEPQARGAWPTCGRCGKPLAGIGTALKPAWEPIILARKPLVGTVAANVLKHGTGAINVDGCRIAGEVPSVPQPDFSRVNGRATHLDAHARIARMSAAPLGRWPANVALDEEAAAMLDEQSGELSSGQLLTHHRRGGDAPIGTFQIRDRTGEPCNFGGDSGGASRFFYTAKASSWDRNDGLDGMPERMVQTGCAGDIPIDDDGKERDGFKVKTRNHHPTVKPTDLMRWLVRLVTPPDGLVLDPFAGSGSTGVAAVAEGFRFIGIEKEVEYVKIMERRIGNVAPLFNGTDGDGHGTITLKED